MEEQSQTRESRGSILEEKQERGGENSKCKRIESFGSVGEGERKREMEDRCGIR